MQYSTSRKTLPSPFKESINSVVTNACTSVAGENNTQLSAMTSPKMDTDNTSQPAQTTHLSPTPTPSDIHKATSDPHAKTASSGDFPAIDKCDEPVSEDMSKVAQPQEARPSASSDNAQNTAVHDGEKREEQDLSTQPTKVTCGDIPSDITSGNKNCANNTTCDNNTKCSPVKIV